jgi:hypothetical protein
LPLLLFIFFNPDRLSQRGGFFLGSSRRLGEAPFSREGAFLYPSVKGHFYKQRISLNLKTLFLYSQPLFEAARLQAVAELTDQHFNADSTLKDDCLVRLFEALFKAQPTVLWAEGQFPLLYVQNGRPQR